MAKALIVSAGNNANEYLARHIGELGYTRPTIVASGGEARRRMDTNDFEVVIINTPLPDEFGHVPVIAAEEKAIRAFGLASAEEMHRLAQRHLECLQREFEKIAR